MTSQQQRLSCILSLCSPSHLRVNQWGLLCITCPKLDYPGKENPFAADSENTAASTGPTLTCQDMGLYLQILLFCIPKIHINENLLFKCRKAFAYNVVLHLHHKTFSYENQCAALSHTIIYIQHNIYGSCYTFSTYTDPFSGKLGSWAIPMLSSFGKVNITSLNVFLKR